jgi:hypothetical protein
MSYRSEFVLTGTMPLLMHHDNIEGSDEVKAWQKNPENKDKSIAGDDRSPAWTWQTYLYENGEHVTMPSDNVSSTLLVAGLQIPPWWETKKKSVKELTQSAIIIEAEHLTFEYGPDHQQLRMSDIRKMRDLAFSEQAKACERLGFRLFAKRAGVNGKKHVRVRPRFEQWRVRGTLRVISENLPLDKLELLFEYAGRSGLCDWRPSSPKRPGPYGMFDAVLKKVA